MTSKGLKRTDIPDHIVPRFWSRVRAGKDSECWPWTRGGKGPMTSSYGLIGFGKTGVNYRMYVTHIVACVLSGRDVPPGMCVLHSCDNPPCCNPKHLRVDTQGANNTDRKNKGREGNRKGTANGRARLNEADVMRIREKSKTDYYRTIAEEYGVSCILIAKIVQRKLWKHVP